MGKRMLLKPDFYKKNQQLKKVQMNQKRNLIKRQLQKRLKEEKMMRSLK